MRRLLARSGRRLGGPHLAPYGPVSLGLLISHISFYEDSAFASRAGKRLLTEVESEHADVTDEQGARSLATPRLATPAIRVACRLRRRGASWAMSRTAAGT